MRHLYFLGINTEWQNLSLPAQKTRLMKHLILALVISLSGFGISAQNASPDSSWKNEYRETAARINNLVHTKLDVKFDYDKSYMYGKAWITLTPHFYPTDSLTLDAKGMDIKEVSLVSGATRKPLKYEYSGMKLDIKLNKTYNRNEKYTVYIDYTAKPDELDVRGSAAITDAKGLYFINPRGEEKDKPTQIWTQGETEATSVWCPTIDRPNQKTTQEISMTVPAKYVTLSNGKLVSQKKNTNGTRTDTWKMDLPHTPYLFFMGVGDYAVIKEQYKGKEVSYYVEKEYAPVAKKIFGNTPEMMRYFSRLLGVEYPWVKYAQMVARDYVSGAMENTTATLHQESAQQDARELVDGNIWENTIAHELFHQWFGDLVTTESWSNLTLNESFANYSEYLWQEYKYGKDAAAEQLLKEMTGYIQSQNENKNLVRFYYPEKESMFDAVSYNKGGCILHMLRNYVGDSAFFKSLNLYLTRNRFQSAEAHQLRLAFEEITGKDLNWFWNQWYFGSGHPKLSIDYVYNDSIKNVRVIVKQNQPGKLFRLPVYVDIYHGAEKKRHLVWLNNKTDTLEFRYTSRPDLVNVDANKMLLAEITDNKSLENYIHQYTNAGTYLDKRQAIDFAAQSDDPRALDLLMTALDDKYFGIRGYALTKLNMGDPDTRMKVEQKLASIASKDPKSTVKAVAINLLATYDDQQYMDIFKKGVADSSYSVSGSSLEALMMVDSTAALEAARKIITQKLKGRLIESTARVLMGAGDVQAFDAIADAFGKMPLSQAKLNLAKPLSDMLLKVTDTEKVKKGVDLIIDLRDAIPAQYGISPYINAMLNNIASGKQASGSKEGAEQAEYIKAATGN